MRGICRKAATGRNELTGSKNTLTPAARTLRQRQTDAERKLWLELRDRRLRGFKFRRQVPKGKYIVDFVCEERHLVVELDGGQHGIRTEYDNQRTAMLEAEGYVVLRFWNNEVMANMAGVLEVIVSKLDG